jgi:hypothetical protein
MRLPQFVTYLTLVSFPLNFRDSSGAAQAGAPRSRVRGMDNHRSDRATQDWPQDLNAAPGTVIADQSTPRMPRTSRPSNPQRFMPDNCVLAKPQPTPLSQPFLSLPSPAVTLSTSGFSTDVPAERRFRSATAPDSHRACASTVSSACALPDYLLY